MNTRSRGTRDRAHGNGAAASSAQDGVNVLHVRASGSGGAVQRMLANARGQRFSVETANDIEGALTRLANSSFNVVLLELDVQDTAGLHTLSRLQEKSGETPMLVLADGDDEDAALRAVLLGAQHYLVKGRLTEDDLANVIHHASESGRAQQDLRRAERRYRALVEQARDAVFVFDAIGRVTYASAAVQRILGYSVSEVVGRSTLDFLEPDDQERMKTAFQQSIEHPRLPVSVSARVRHKDGSWRLLDGVFTNLLDEPAVQGIVNNYRDVTASRRAEDTVGWLSLAVEQGPASVIMTDVNGHVEYVNERFTRDTGYTLEEVLGKKAGIIKSGRTPREVYATLWRTIKSGNPYRGELLNRTKAGELRWHDVQISPVKDEHGNITRFVGVQTDVTERKRTEDALRESNGRFQQLAEHTDLVFFVMAADFRETLYINPAYLDVFGRTQASLYENPSSWLDAIVPEDRPRMMDHVARIRSGERLGPIEYNVRHPNGCIRSIVSTAVAVRDEMGIIYRISGVARDVTELADAREALAESEARLRTLTEASFDALDVTENGIIREVNEGFVKMFGFDDVSEVIGRHVSEFVAPESLDTVMHRTVENHDGRYDVVGVKKDGTKIMLEVIGKPYVVKGKSTRLAALRDVTLTRRLEEQYRQAQKMEAVGRLAGGVAHDFNNLLTVIFAHSDMLLHEMIPGDHRIDSVKQIREAGDSAASLTRQLLAFSRRDVIEPRTIKLSDALARMRSLLARLIGEDIELRLHFAEEALTVRIDPGQLEQTVMNLAVNARDAMSTGGRLTIETSFADVAPRHSPDQTLLGGRFAVVRVIDTGHGMDAATKAQIFEPFFTTKEPGKGTGLGLATVYSVVRQAGGFVEVKSEPGMGSTFEIFLPEFREDHVARPDADEDNAPIPQGKETVLLVEDSPAVREVARRTLEKHGYLLLEAPGPLEALLIAKRPGVRIDLLVTDIVMPKMSGRVLAERFAEIHPGARILYMSGYTNDEVVRHGVLASKVPYLQKPFTPRVLARRVRELLDGTPAASSG